MKEKKFSSIFLILIFLFFSIQIECHIEINNCEELNNLIKDDSTERFELNEDIDCKGYHYIPKKNFDGIINGKKKPTKKKKKNFSPFFNLKIKTKIGNFFSIYNLNISEIDSVGLFFNTSRNSLIANLSIVESQFEIKKSNDNINLQMMGAFSGKSI